MHVIGAKAECFYEAMQPEFKKYSEQIIKNAKSMCDELMSKGVKVVSGGTDNHLFLIDVNTSFGITGKEAEKVLDDICITVNKNTIPGETLSPSVTSGLRLGTPAMTTRGFKEKEFIYVADIIYDALSNHDDKKKIKELKNKVLELTSKFPIYR